MTWRRLTRKGREGVLAAIRPGSAFNRSTSFGVSGCLGWMSFRWRSRFSGRTATSQIGQRSILFTATPFATEGRSQGELVFRNDADGGTNSRVHGARGVPGPHRIVAQDLVD